MREACVMRLKPGNEAIYKEKHDNISENARQEAVRSEHPTDAQGGCADG